MNFFALVAVFLLLNCPSGLLSIDNDPLAPTVSEILRSNCRCRRGINSPTEYLDYPTEMNLKFHIVRLVDIDDVGELLAFDAGILVEWTDKCVEKLIHSDQFPIAGINNGSVQLMIMDWQELWNPDVLIINGVQQKSLLDPQFSQALRYRVDNEMFQAIHYGKYEAYCNLQFWNFPFDTQSCSFQFYMYQRMPFAVIDKFEVVYDPIWVPENSNWIYLNHSISRLFRAENDDFFVFSFQFQRKHQYFFLNLYFPGYILLLLQVSAFFIPPNKPDRPAFAATIMLAMFVLHSQTLSYLPKTPQPIVAAYSVIGSIIFGTVVTIYSGIMCNISNWPSMKRKIHFDYNGKAYKLYIFVDFLAFLTSFVLLICFLVIPVILMTLT